MCEFKIISQNSGAQISEDIVILSYSDDNELLLKDVLGMGDTLESALIMNVNTLNQECLIVEHPIIKNFLHLIKKEISNEDTKEALESFKNDLDKFMK